MSSIRSTGRKDLLYRLMLWWLMLPMLIFLVGWLRWYIGEPVALALVWVAWRTRFVDDAPPVPAGMSIRSPRLWLVLGLVAAGLLFFGLGGFTYQERWDNSFRNAIFSDLCSRSWPVAGVEDGVEEILCYYFAFWLPPALVAKIFGSFTAGAMALYLYGLAGASMAVLAMMRWWRKLSLVALLIFIFFSGWDLVGFFIYKDVNLWTFVLLPKDLSLTYFSYPGLAVHVAFIYNQGIAVWVASMYLLRQKDNPGELVLPFACFGFFSPIGAAGAFVALLAGLLRGRWRVFTYSNVTGAVAGLLVLMFMAQNQHAFFQVFPFCTEILEKYLLFFIFTFGIFIPFVWEDVRRDALFWLLVLPLPVLEWLQLDTSYDFSMRVAMVPGFYLMLCVVRRFLAWRGWPVGKVLLTAVLAVSLTGQMWVYFEYAHRNIRARVGLVQTRAWCLPTTFMPNRYHENFVTAYDGFYRRNVMRQPDFHAVPDNSLAMPCEPLTPEDTVPHIFRTDLKIPY